RCLAVSDGRPRAERPAQTRRADQHGDAGHQAGPEEAPLPVCATLLGPDEPVEVDAGRGRLAGGGAQAGGQVHSGSSFLIVTSARPRSVSRARAVWLFTV